MKGKKIGKLEFLKIIKLCTPKEAIHKVRRQPTEWKKILGHYISDKSLYPEYIKNFYHSTKDQPNDKGLAWTVLQGRHTNGLKLMKRCQTSAVMMEMQIKTTK